MDNIYLERQLRVSSSAVHPHVCIRMRRSFCFLQRSIFGTNKLFGTVAGLDGAEWERRTGLLDGGEIGEIDSFVDRKVGELKTRILAWEPQE